MLFVFLVFISDAHSDTSPIQFLAGIWVLATFVVQIGQWSRFPYARELVAQSRAVHLALDIRLATAAIFVAVLLVSALNRAVGRGSIGVEDIPSWHMPPADPSWHPLWTAFVTPIILIVEALLQVLWFVANIGWMVVVVVVVFFLRLGACVIELIVEILTSNHFARAVASAATAWVGSLAMFALSCKFTHHITPYLFAPGWTRAVAPLVMMLLMGLGIAMCGSIAVWVLLRVDIDELIREGAFVFSNALAIILFAALTLVVLARIDTLALASMRSPGLYSWLMLMIAGTGVTAWLSKKRTRG